MRRRALAAPRDKLAAVSETVAQPVFTYRRRIDFADTDVGGFVHFSRFFVFMETAEHELLRSLGTSVHLERDGAVYGWPRVEASLSFFRPIRFGEEVEVRVAIQRRGVKSMTYGFRFFRDEELLAEGYMTSVCCRLDGEGGPRPVPIPPFIGDRLPREAR